MSVGDVHSAARGSGARYNDGKPPLNLIPLSVIANSFALTAGSSLEIEVVGALHNLGQFQTGGWVGSLGEAIAQLNRHWRACADVFNYGRRKYAEWNWAKGMAWSIPMGCAGRHALWVLEGEEEDSESHLPHVGHILCNLVMLRTYVDTYPEGNDLPSPSLFVHAPDPLPAAPTGGVPGWDVPVMPLIQN